jgi:uncharacterized membrane protein
VSVVSKVWYVRSRAARLGLLASILGLASLVSAAPVGAVDTITLTTPYPAVAVAPGSSVNFEISVATDTAGRVDLAVAGAPDGWDAVLRGGGFTVDGVETDGKIATKVTLNVDVPAEATAGTQRITVRATASGASASLPVDIRVAPNAAGEITLTTDTPELKGASDATFTFSLTLTNDTAEDLPFSAVASGPAGWTVTAQIGTQAQAASVVVDAGSTSTVSVTAKASADAPAGPYPIGVEVSSGNRSASQGLSVEITGSYRLALSTSDGRLNMNASAGSATDLTLVLTNTGTADIEAATLAATAPSGWTVTFDPPTVSVPAQGEAQTIASVTPSADAIAGDYVTTFRATAPVANASSEVRVTIETSLLWGAVGIALIAIVLVGLWWTFRRYGRR